MSGVTMEILEARSTPEPNSGCTIWLGTTLRNGYGQLKAGGRRYLAHRAAWEMECGPIPDGLDVRHYVCANRACINVRHLRLGTAKDNAQDRAADGHTVRGARVHCAKLSAASVLAMRKEWDAGGVSVDDLSARHGVSRSSAWAAATRKTWRHL